MRQFNPAHLSLRQFNLARLSHVGGDAAVDGNAQAARSNERGDARKRDGHRSHAANAVHNNEPLGVPHRLFEARTGKAFRDPPSRHLARASKKRAVSNQKLGLLGPSVKKPSVSRLELFLPGRKAMHKGAWPPCYARGACQHAQNAVCAAISPPDNESRFRYRTRRSYLAREKNATMAQISLAWMLCNKP